MKLKYNSPLVLTFAIISTVVYFLNSAMGGALSELFVLPPYFNTSDITDYFSIFLYVLGHANIQHLLGNMMFILLIGPILEEKYGMQKLLVMIVITALVTAILNMMFFDTGLLGASGIVFLFIILVSFTNVRKGQIPLTFIIILLLYVGKEVVQSMENNNISEFAHILGGICGSIFGFTSSGRTRSAA